MICAAPWSLRRCGKHPAFSRPVQGETIAMRLIVAAVLGSAIPLLAACASNPKPTAPQAAAAPASQPNSSDKYSNIDATNISDAQRAGYKVVNEKGKQLYCRRDLITGTRLHYQTTCLTAEQLAQQKRDADEMMRPAQAPVPKRE
jgi:hypothetical protein